MGLLDSFEKGLERAVNGAFAKTFRSGIQPVEIASALRSELDKKAAVVSRDRILAPNTFTVRLSPADDERCARSATRSSTSSTPSCSSTRRRRATRSPAGLDHARARRPARRRACSASTRRTRRAGSPGAACSTSTASGTRSSSRARSSAAAATPTSRSTTPARAASTSRSSGTASAPGARPRLHERHACSTARRSPRPRCRPTPSITIGRTDIVFRVLAQAAPAQAADARRRRHARLRRPRRWAAGMSELTLLLLRIGFLRAAVGLRLRGRLLAALRPVRREGATDAGARAAARRRRARRPAAGATAPAAPVAAAAPAAGPRADRRRPTTASRIVITCGPEGRARARRSATSRSRSAARASRASSSATTTPRPTTPASAVGRRSG